MNRVLHYIKNILTLWCPSHLLNLWGEDLPGALLKPVHVHCTVEWRKQWWKQRREGLRLMKDKIAHRKRQGVSHSTCAICTHWEFEWWRHSAWGIYNLQSSVSCILLYLKFSYIYKRKTCIWDSCEEHPVKLGNIFMTEPVKVLLFPPLTIYNYYINLLVFQTDENK